MSLPEGLQAAKLATARRARHTRIYVTVSEDLRFCNRFRISASPVSLHRHTLRAPRAAGIPRG
jgi:hypothetical protein